MPISLPLLFALGSVYVFWGSTFAAMHIATETMPPFAMSSIRFAVAGAIVWTIAAARGEGRPTRSELVIGAITGTSLLAIGNGLSAWAVGRMPTGLASLLISLSPIWMLGFDYLIAGARTTRLAIAGIVIAVVGLGILVSPRVDETLPLMPTIAILVGSVTWAFGSIVGRRFGSRRLFISTAAQMVAGSALLALIALGTGEWFAFHPAAISAWSLGGLAWLIVFGSVVAYSSYLYVMKNAPVALASTFAYVNPLIAVILGATLFHERVSPIAGFGGATILVGVACMMLPAGAFRRRAGS